jgi:hypothetical protein
MGCDCTEGGGVGQSVPLFTKRTFSFTELQAGKSLELVMVKTLEVGDYGDATLVVRVHSLNIGSSTSRIEVSAYPTAPSVLEPETDFIASSPVATSTLVSGMPAGTLVVDPVSPNFGGCLQIRVKGTRASGTVTAVLSAELILRSGTATKPKILGDFRLVSASPVLAVGNGEGSPRIELDKAADGSASLVYRTAGVERWTVAEDDSQWLVFGRYDSSGNWQDDPLLIRESDGGVRGKILHYTHHVYNQASYGYCIVPWEYIAEAQSTSNASSFVGSYYNWGIAPFNGRLVKVFVRSTNAWSGINSAAVALYIISEGSTTKTLRGSWSYSGSESANDTREYSMTSTSTVNKGEKITIVVWVNSSNAHGDVQVTGVWEFDQTEGHGQPS